MLEFIDKYNEAVLETKTQDELYKIKKEYQMAEDGQMKIHDQFKKLGKKLKVEIDKLGHQSE